MRDPYVDFVEVIEIFRIYEVVNIVDCVFPSDGRNWMDGDLGRARVAAT